MTKSIDPVIRVQITYLDTLLAHHATVMEYLSNQLGTFVEPILAHDNLELDEKLDTLLIQSGYWQFETRRRIRALKKLRERSKRPT